jgi:hypothetical protein
LVFSAITIGGQCISNSLMNTGYVVLLADYRALNHISACKPVPR